MCHLPRVTTRQTDRQTDAEQSDPYVPLCFAVELKTVIDFAFWSNR